MDRSWREGNANVSFDCPFEEDTRFGWQHGMHVEQARQRRAILLLVMLRRLVLYAPSDGRTAQR